MMRHYLRDLRQVWREFRALWREATDLPRHIRLLTYALSEDTFAEEVRYLLWIMERDRERRQRQPEKQETRP